MIWAAGNPQIYRGWPPKNFPKIQNFHLRKVGAAALGLHQKVCSQVLASRRCISEILFSGISAAAGPSKRRDAVMRSTRMRRGSAISAPRCYYASRTMRSCFSAAVLLCVQNDAFMFQCRGSAVSVPQRYPKIRPFEFFSSFSPYSSLVLIF